MLENKIKNLKDNIKNMKAVYVAFSGGVDSTFLLAVAKEVLDDKVVAVNVKGPNFTKAEGDFAKKFCEKLGVKLITVDKSNEIMEAISKNNSDRCYVCKKAIFTELVMAAKNECINGAGTSKEGCWKVVDGSNLDDLSDYRPGRKATKELGVLSPLEEAGLYKSEIRQGLKEMGIEIWDKPAFACLASRIPTGTEITIEKLKQIEGCEDILREIGFTQIRVRHHGDTARIEIEDSEFKLALQRDIRKRIVEDFRDQGFRYVALDLAGYAMGNMN